MKKLHPTRLVDLKKEAKQLYKLLKASEPTTHSRFKTAFPNLFASKNETDAGTAPFQLKHAYALLAQEYGFETWSSLKEHLICQDMLFRKNGIHLIHAWFNKAPQATDYFDKNKGYLLKFWDDYVICGEEYIQLLKLDNHKKEWREIGYNWIDPKNIQAHNVLHTAAKANYLNL